MPESATLPSETTAVSHAAVKRTARWGNRIDFLQVGLVLVFAFLAGSFVARNSDMWLHLATGRLLANGAYSFGTDPFSYVTAGRYWANHAWLSNLGLFLVYRAFGGGAIVVVKAAIVAATAGLMLLATRGRGPIWLTTGCVLLAVMAMTPRLLLQPMVLSYFLLATCLLCLQTGGKALRIVPVLIALWVNLDSWFILGPALVVMFWVGRRLDANELRRDPWPQWFVPASLVACLVSPHHIFALRLPPELSLAVWTSGFPSDPRFANLFLSPWHLGPLGSAGGYNLAAWAFFILFALGLLSFAVNRQALMTWRGLVWVSFALLAAWQARLVPFFAVVAGPITALNLRELRCATWRPRLCRGLALVLSLALVGLGWLGWTNGLRNRDRGAGWAVHTDATLERAATGIAKWRAKNIVESDAQVFASHPDLSHYLAWFAPGEKSFLDIRLQLFTDAMSEYVSLSHAVGLLPGKERDAELPHELMERHRIKAIALYDPDIGRMTSALHTVFRDEQSRWVLTRIDGGVVLIVPRATGKTASGFDPERAAFGIPNDDDVPAAWYGPDVLTEPLPPWDIKRARGRRGSWEADAATVYIHLFQDRLALEREFAAPILPGPFQSIGRAIFASASSARSPAYPLLAIRAARRGIELDSRDSTAWLMLGRAYLHLGEHTWERDAGGAFSPLGQLRLVQATTALVQATLLNPESIGARQALAGMYIRRHALDLAHRHAAEAVRLVRRAGPVAGETRESFDARLARDAEFAERIEGAVFDQENRYLVMTFGLAGDPLTRARIANDLGLLQKAIDVLMQSHPDLYGTEGISLLIDLLLQTGQAAEARVLLDRQEFRRAGGVLGAYNLAGKPHPDGSRWAYPLPAYEWFNFCQFASSGKYNLSLASLDAIRELFAQQELASGPMLVRILQAELAAEIGQAAMPGSPFDLLPISLIRLRQADFLVQIRILSVHRADLSTLAGILELERGNSAGAVEQFRAAKALYAAVESFAPSLPGLPLANRFLNACQGQR